MKRPPSLYRSGIVTIHATRSGPCIDCGERVHHKRTITGVDAAEQRERWKAQPLRCFDHQRAFMRAQAGVL